MTITATDVRSVLSGKYDDSYIVYVGYGISSEMFRLVDRASERLMPPRECWREFKNAGEKGDVCAGWEYYSVKEKQLERLRMDTPEISGRKPPREICREVKAREKAGRNVVVCSRVEEVECSPALVVAGFIAKEVKL